MGYKQNHCTSPARGQQHVLCHLWRISKHWQMPQGAKISLIENHHFIALDHLILDSLTSERTFHVRIYTHLSPLHVWSVYAVPLLSLGRGVAVWANWVQHPPAFLLSQLDPPVWGRGRANSLSGRRSGAAAESFPSMSPWPGTGRCMPKSFWITNPGSCANISQQPSVLFFL